MFDLDRVSKTVWFFLPIAISLFVNLVMFIVTSIELCRLDYHVRKRRQLQLQVKETRRQMLERYELDVYLLRAICIIFPDYRLCFIFLICKLGFWFSSSCHLAWVLFGQWRYSLVFWVMTWMKQNGKIENCFYVVQH